MISPESTNEKRALRPIEYHIKTDYGMLSGPKDLIEQAYLKALPIVTEELGAEGIDIIFTYNPDVTFEDSPVAGISSSDRVYIFTDSKHERITEEILFAIILHEVHHCVRSRHLGSEVSLGKKMVDEGLACLYEEQHTGQAPICAVADLSDANVKKAMRIICEEYDNPKLIRPTGYIESSPDCLDWLFGSDSIERWFGYTLGYRLCKEYSERTGKSASDMVNLPAETILEPALAKFIHETL